jgi:SAM-dependent methyltransferase
VLEVGSGTGAISRFLADLPGVRRVTGIDPSPILVAHARAIGGPSHLSFDEGDGRALPYADAEFDLAVFHTVLCHVPGVEAPLAEAFRVLRAGGQIAVFDGDYATTTVAIGDTDPLTICADAAIEAVVHDRWRGSRRRRPGVDRAHQWSHRRRAQGGSPASGSSGHVLRPHRLREPGGKETRRAVLTADRGRC